MLPVNCAVCEVFLRPHGEFLSLALELWVVVAKGDKTLHTLATKLSSVCGNDTQNAHMVKSLGKKPISIARPTHLCTSISFEPFAPFKAVLEKSTRKMLKMPFFLDDAHKASNKS